MISKENHNLLRVIWATRDEKKIINSECEKAIVNLIQQQLSIKSCQLHFIYNEEHYVDIIINLHVSTDLSSVMQVVKGSISYHINRNNLTEMKFIWKKGFHSEPKTLECLEKAIDTAGVKRKTTYREETNAIKKRIRRLAMLAKYA